MLLPSSQLAGSNVVPSQYLSSKGQGLGTMPSLFPYRERSIFGQNFPYCTLIGPHAPSLDAGPIRSHAVGQIEVYQVLHDAACPPHAPLASHGGGSGCRRITSLFRMPCS